MVKSIFLYENGSSDFNNKFSTSSLKRASQNYHIFHYYSSSSSVPELIINRIVKYNKLNVGVLP